MVHAVQSSNQCTPRCAVEQVGKTGRAVGMDVKRLAVQLARDSVESLASADVDFANRAAPIRFHVQNVFMPMLRHKVIIFPFVSCPLGRIAHPLDLTLCRHPIALYCK